MVSWLWMIFVFVVTYTAIALLKVPLWLFLILVAPLIAVGCRMEELDKKIPLLEKIGFKKIDAFFLRSIPTSVIYVFMNEADRSYFYLYHLGPKMAWDFIDSYENNISLTTGSAVDGGMTPRPPQALL